MDWRDFPGLPSHVDYVVKEDLVGDMELHSPHIPLNPSSCINKTPTPVSTSDQTYLLQERAAIREFDGNQTREEAELDAQGTLFPPAISREQAIQNAEDILGARVVPDDQAKAILSKPIGWKGEKYND